MQYRFINRSEIVRRVVFQFFLQIIFIFFIIYYITLRRAPDMLNINKSLDVDPAGFHDKFIYNYIKKCAKIKTIRMRNQIYIFYVH